MYYTVTRDEHDDDGAPEDTKRKRRSRDGAPKEKVLHTRVPAVLEDELKRLAKNLRVPVSNVVRAILEDAVDAVDAVGEVAEGEITGFVDRLQRQRDNLRGRVKKKRRKKAERDLDDDRENEVEDEDTLEEEPTGDPASECPDAADELLDGAFGFQSLVLAADAECGACGKTLAAGTSACRALFDDPRKRVFLGPKCRLMPEKG